MRLLSFFEGELSLDIPQIVELESLLFLHLFFTEGKLLLLLFSVSFEEFVFPAGRYEVKFEVKDLLLGLFVNIDGGNLAKERGFLEKHFCTGLLFEEKLSEIHETLFTFTFHQFEDFIAQTVRELVEVFIHLGDMLEDFLNVLVLESIH